MYHQLKSVLNKVISLNEEEWATISAAFKEITVPSKQELTHIGDIEDRLYFVLKGVLRLYCIDAKGQESTIFLFSENHFASCYHSFLTSVASDQALQALEPCTLLSIEKEDLDRLHTVLPKMNLLTRKIAEQRFINAQNIFTGHISQTPEQRYLAFERTHGNLMLRVPQHIIASFLGITPVSLSRIRKRLTRK